MGKFGEFISLYRAYCNGGNAFDDSNNEINETSNDNLNDDNELYAMLTNANGTQDSNAKSNQRPGNVNRLLSKAHSTS